MIPAFRARVVDVEGTPRLRFTEAARRGFDMWLMTLLDKDVVLVAKEATNTRSERANAYYWSTVLPLLAKENEQTEEEVHDAMCELFLPNERKRVEFFNRMTGETLAVECDGRRSSKLSGGKFYDFVERVRLWGVEFLGVVTPDPDPEYWRKRQRRSEAA